MAVICPTVTATDAHQYSQQMEGIATFVHRVHVDLMDGVLAPTKSPPLDKIWWPVGVKADLHLMYQKPVEALDAIIEHQPSLVIIHAEAEGNFVNIAQRLSRAGIKVGVALLPKTSAETIQPSLSLIDHILIFSGDLGHFGGKADLGLLNKVKSLKKMKADLEIGWDGGINSQNIESLVEGGVDVLNVGGFIQKAQTPRDAYAKLKSLAEKQRDE